MSAGPTSWNAMAWAYDLDLKPAIARRNRPRAKAVLAALCFHCSERNGDVVWPSVGRLAAMTGYSRRTVGLALDELEAVGLIRRGRRHREDGARAADLVEILFDLSEFPSPRGGPDEATSPRDDDLGEVSARDQAKSLHHLGEATSQQEPQGEPQPRNRSTSRGSNGSGEATSPRRDGWRKPRLGASLGQRLEDDLERLDPMKSRPPVIEAISVEEVNDG